VNVAFGSYSRSSALSPKNAVLAHLPIYALEDLGFVPRGETGAFIAERNTAPAKIPVC